MEKPRELLHRVFLTQESHVFSQHPHSCNSRDDRKTRKITVCQPQVNGNRPLLADGGNADFAESLEEEHFTFPSNIRPTQVKRVQCGFAIMEVAKCAERLQHGADWKPGSEVGDQHPHVTEVMLQEFSPSGPILSIRVCGAPCVTVQQPEVGSGRALLRKLDWLWPRAACISTLLESSKGLTTRTQAWNWDLFSTPPCQGPSITILDTPAESAPPVCEELAGGGRFHGALRGWASRKQGKSRSPPCCWQLSWAPDCFPDGKHATAGQLRKTTGLASGAGCGG
uniref:Uncharacterized protein n=1 Tax=Rangifer tarandus platyrhynchus TaxID=3082113 RepID=A0ACB0FJR4_RANTA|nr:unnamed protein product [Rangifer tarandus platyrhynchus]